MLQKDGLSWCIQNLYPTMANPSSLNYRIQNHDHLYPSVAIIELEEIAVLTVTLLEI